MDNKPVNLSRKSESDKNPGSETDSVGVAQLGTADRANAIKELAERKWMGKVAGADGVPPNDAFLTGSASPSAAVGPDSPQAREISTNIAEQRKKEYEEFQKHVAMAFRLQEAKVVSSALTQFQKNRIFRGWFHFHFLDEDGNVDVEAELQFESEWWTVVVYWLTFIFFMVILGFVVVSVSDIGTTDFLMSRIGSRVVVACVGATFLCLYPRFTVRVRRRLLTGMIAMYFTALIMTEMERVMILTGPTMLNWYSCETEDFIDCNKKSCKSILPFLTSQCSLVSTFLRLPFHHMAYLVLYVCVLYLATGFGFQVSLFQEGIGLMYEAFCLFLAFGVLVLAARRVEVLSRYLFLRTQKEGCEAIQNFGSAPPKQKVANTDDDTFFAKMIAVCMRGAQAFVGKKSFMTFESLVVFGSGKLNLENITFYDEDMEFCFKLGRWEVTKKWCLITFSMLFPCFVIMSVKDVFDTTQERYCGEETEDTCTPDDFVMARIIPRGVWVVIAAGVMYFASRKLLFQLAAKRQVSKRYSIVVTIIIGYFTVIIMTETVRLAGLFQNTLVCSEPSCICYAMLSFVTAQFSYMLVMIRLPFNLTMMCLIVVSVVYVLSGVLINVQTEAGNSIMYEISCLLLMCFCFTISAHRSDVLARAHFLLEYGATSDDHLVEEVEKKLKIDTVK